MDAELCIRIASRGGGRHKTWPYRGGVRGGVCNFNAKRQCPHPERWKRHIRKTQEKPLGQKPHPCPSPQGAGICAHTFCSRDAHSECNIPAPQGEGMCAHTFCSQQIDSTHWTFLAFDSLSIFVFYSMELFWKYFRLMQPHSIKNTLTSQAA